MFQRLIFSFFLFLTLLGNLQASEKLKDFYLHYKEGKYLKALVALEEIRADREFESTRAYLSALCYKNLQNFEKSILFFKKAVKLKHKAQELMYEYGQVLYGANELEKAQRAFRISFEQGYKKSFSLYYQAHIGELLDQPGKTKANYLKLVKDEKADKNLRQVALFRLGELIFGYTRNKFKAINYIEKYVVPLMNKAIEVDPDSKVATEIEQRLDEILLEFNIHPLMMVNGRRLGKEGKNLNFIAKVKRDDNVTQETDSAGSSSGATYFDSFIYDLTLDWSYRWILKKRFVLTPELNLNFVQYSDDVNAEVFQNNSYSIAPAFRTSTEHTFFGKRASFLLDWEYNYTARDKESKEERDFYGRSQTIVVGQRVRFMPNGDSTFRLKFKSYTNYLTSQNSSTNTFVFDQIYVRSNGHILIYLFNLDMTKVEDETYSTNSYLNRIDYLLPSFYGGLSLNFNTSLTLLDTKLQKETRGMEKTLGLGVKISKRMGKKIKLSVFYDYTKNTSKDAENYSYTKNVYGLELRAGLF